MNRKSPKTRIIFWIQKDLFDKLSTWKKENPEENLSELLREYINSLVTNNELKL